MRHRHISVATALSIAFASAPALAQVTVGRQSAERCDAALAKTDTHLDLGLHLGELAHCGERGAAGIARLLCRLRKTEDVGTLQTAASTAYYLVDRRIVASADVLARDESATPAARVTGLMILLTYAKPTLSFDAPWRTLLAIPLGRRCGYAGLASEVVPDTVSALPAAFVDSLAATTDQLARRDATPALVRDVARCVRNAVGPRMIEQAPDLSGVELQYLCSRSFRVRNPGPTAVTLRYEVEGTSESRAIYLAARSAVNIMTRTNGPVRLCYGDRLIQRRPNGAVPCQ